MSCSGLVTKCICFLAGCGVNALSGLQELAKSINCDCPHRPDKLAHRATYTCHVSFQLTHRQQLVGTACVIIDAADHLHLHFKTPRAGNHVAHCRNGIDVTAFQNPRHHTQGWICLQYRPTRGGFLRLNEKCRRHRVALRCPWLSPVSDAPLAQPYLPDRPD